MAYLSPCENSFVFIKIMIKRISFIRSFCESVYLHDKCRTLASSISTSAVYQFRKEERSVEDFKNNFNGKHIRKYEDTFGDIEGFEAKFREVRDDPEDILEDEKQKAAPGKTLQQYAREMKSLIAKKDYKSALKLLEVDMRNDRIIKTRFFYKYLMYYNAELGDLREAYRLFIDYKRRNGIVTGAIYTVMFNACANCKNSFLALKKAEALRECMNKNTFHKVNIANYNVMMKAYGRHGDIHTCLKIMDEVMEKRGKVYSGTYAFLQQACITDTNSGFRHALLVWRKMLQNTTKPTIFNFNLMLRCIRDCSLGEISLIPSLIQQILDDSKYFYKTKIKVKVSGDDKKVKVRKILSDGSKLIKPSENKSISQEVEENSTNLVSIHGKEPELLNSNEISESLINKNQAQNWLDISNNKDDSVEHYSDVNENMKLKNKSLQNEFEWPNLLALKPTVGSLIDFNGVITPQHRFMLVGGVDGFLKTMDEFQVRPDIKTFTLLLSLIPSTLEAEEKLISLADSYKIQLDTGFYNVLIKRRILRSENHLIKDALEQMYRRNIQPDILTFGILAMSCDTHESGMELLENLHKHGFRVSSAIIDVLLKKAEDLRDMKYVLAILRAAKEDGTEIDSKCLTRITHIIEREKRLKLLEKENSGGEAVSNEHDILVSNIATKNAPFE